MAMRAQTRIATLNILLAALERLISTGEVFAEKLSFYSRENLPVILSVTALSQVAEHFIADWSNWTMN
jgi:hypothetical protein